MKQYLQYKKTQQKLFQQYTKIQNTQYIHIQVILIL